MPPDTAPKPVRRHHGRLSSAKNPSGRPQRRTQTRPAGPVCPNPECSDPTKIETMDDQKICGSCGTLIEDSMIHADVTFGESAAGAAVVQGGFVGEGQRFAKSLGTAFRRVGGTESREVTENQGRDEIRKQCHALHISEDIGNRALRIYKLAAVNGFIQGRRIRIVVASAVYIGCRQQKKNTVLLMDFAELLQVSVYKIGQCYEDLKKTLYMDDNFDNDGLEQVEVESYIERFANRLEFGSKTIQVSEDACRLMKRMKRDWMVTGRAPAGLCGACLILAARMNNFRRSVREVVYVVKVCDITIAKRLEEFKRTRAADLSVDQFREYGNRLKHANDPPALYEAKKREAKKRRKLGHESRDSESLISNISDSPTESQQNRAPVAQMTQSGRTDQDGFAIPDLPAIDPSLSTAASTLPSSSAESVDSDETPASPPKRKRGRPRKDEIPLPVITAADLEVEDMLEQEMESYLDGGDLTAQLEAAYADAEAKSKEIAALEKQREENEARLRRTLSRASSEAGQTTSSENPRPAGEESGHMYNGAHITTVSSAEEIGEDEFEDDPEVSRCLLTPAEVRVKESIWVTHNEDWLRAQQAKVLKKALDEANGRGKSASRTRRRKPTGRMGDGSLLEGAEVASAAEASVKMLDKRAGRGKGFSKHVNYEALMAVYGGDEDAGSEVSSAVGGGGSRQASTAPDGPAREGAARVQQATSEGPAREVVARVQQPTPEATQQSREQSASSSPPADGGAAAVDKDGPLPTPAATGEEAATGAAADTPVVAGAVAGAPGDATAAPPTTADDYGDEDEDEEEDEEDDDDDDDDDDNVNKAFAGEYEDDDDEHAHQHYDDEDEVGFFDEDE